VTQRGIVGDLSCRATAQNSLNNTAAVLILEGHRHRAEARICEVISRELHARSVSIVSAFAVLDLRIDEGRERATVEEVRKIQHISPHRFETALGLLRR